MKRHLLAMTVALTATLIVLGPDARAACRVALDATGTQYVLSSPAFQVKIDRATGLPNCVESLKPSPMSLWKGTDRSIALAVEDRDRSWEKVFDSPTSIKQWSGEDKVGRFAAVESRLTANGIDGSAILSVRIYDDRLCIDGTVKFDKAVSEPLIIRLSQPYDAGLWNRQIFYEPQGRAKIITPTATCLRHYGFDLSDRSTYDFAPSEFPWLMGSPKPRVVEGWSLDNTNYPRGILEASDRYLLYGNLDVGQYALFATNWKETGPCMLHMPKVIKDGDTLRFSLIYKVFPRPRNMLSDVCRWYSENLYSSIPLSKGIVTLQHDPEPRQLLTPGNVATGAGDYPSPSELIHRLKISQIIGIKPKLDELPLPGSPGERALLEAIKLDQKAGFKVFVYFRQAAFGNTFHKDRPRYMDWALEPRENMVWDWGTRGVPYGIIPASSVDWNSENNLLAMDTCNPDLIDWYIKDLKRFIDIYQPDGIQWDMGWETNAGPCLKHPEAGVHHGVIRIQKEIYEYIRQKHPNVRVTQNEVVGSPSMLYCDLVMSEEGADITPEMLANVEHYRVSLMGLYYVHTYKARYGENWQARYIHDIMRNLSLGFTWGFGNYPDVMDKPNLTRLTDIADFSALANSLPRVIEPEAIRIKGNDAAITRRVWAGKERMLVAIYNDGDTSAALEAAINLKVLAGKYYRYYGKGPVKITVLSDAGMPTAGKAHAEYRDGALHITGILGKHQLMLLEAGK